MTFRQILLALLLASSIRAQLSTTTQINGTVTDSTGAVVAGATVTALNTATQAKSTADSNQDGSYVINGLIPGTYTVTVTKAGFQTFKESEVVLHPARSSR